MQLNCVLADIEISHRLYYGDLPEVETLDKTEAFVRACGIQKKLKGTRMAVIGRRTEEMTPTAMDEVQVLRLFGARLLKYGLDELQEMAAKIPRADAEAAWARISAGAARVMSKTEHGITTARNYLVVTRRQPSAFHYVSVRSK